MRVRVYCILTTCMQSIDMPGSATRHWCVFTGGSRSLQTTVDGYFGAPSKLKDLWWSFSICVEVYTQRNFGIHIYIIHVHVRGLYDNS